MTLTTIHRTTFHWLAGFRSAGPPQRKNACTRAFIRRQNHRPSLPASRASASMTSSERTSGVIDGQTTIETARKMTKSLIKILPIRSITSGSCGKRSLAARRYADRFVYTTTVCNYAVVFYCYVRRHDGAAQMGFDRFFDVNGDHTLWPEIDLFLGRRYPYSCRTRSA